MTEHIKYKGTFVCGHEGVVELPNVETQELRIHVKNLLFDAPCKECVNIYDPKKMTEGLKKYREEISRNKTFLPPIT